MINVQPGSLREQGIQRTQLDAYPWFPAFIPGRANLMECRE